MSVPILDHGLRPVIPRFTQLVDAVERARAHYAVCGAIAMGAHGFVRNTVDIDVLIAAADLERVIAELSPPLEVLDRQPADGPAKQVRLRPANEAPTIEVDLLVPLDALEHWALTTCVRGRFFDRTCDVVSAEAAVVMKLAAAIDNRASYAAGHHQMDAARLLATGNVDVDALRAFLRAHPQLAEALEALLAAPPPRGRLR